MKACSVPIPPGEIGTSVARLCVTWTSRTFRIDWWTPKAPRKNQIATKRSSQSPACQARRAEVLGPVAENREAQADALLELVDVHARPHDPDRPEDRQRDQQHGGELRVSREEAESKPGRLPSEPMPGRTPSVSAYAKISNAIAVSKIESTSSVETSVM